MPEMPSAILVSVVFVCCSGVMENQVHFDAGVEGRGFHLQLCSYWSSPAKYGCLNSQYR
jgi:hypothetical protein